MYLFSRFIAVATLLIFPLSVFAHPESACIPPDNSTISGTLSSDIILSEMLPAPENGQEEFIEIKNTGKETVNLTGWQLRDASEKTYVISDEDFSQPTIKAGAYFVVPQSISKIYLNNDTDSITLIQPNDEVLDKTTYEDAQKGASWAKSSGKWQWSTSATPGKENHITQNPQENEESDKEKSAADAESKKDYETSDSVSLSELLPDPSGLDSSDEWIEIMNTGKAISLDGWQLTDETTYYTIQNVSIGTNEHMVFEVGDTKINLNNTGDTIYLIDPFGKVMHGTSYEGAVEGASWMVRDGEWHWSATPTPGEENVLSPLDEPAGDAEQENEGDGQIEGDADVVAVELFRSLEDGATASVEGVVTVVPDVYGSQYFYIQDDSSGIQVYSYSKAFPELSVGDRVRVSGEKSTARGETRMKTTAIEDIAVVGSGEVVARDTAQLEESLEGMLVQTEGVITERSSNDAMLNDSIHILFKDGAGIDKDLFEEGTTVSVIGIESQYDEDYRLLPRSNDDIAGGNEESGAIPSASASGSFQENPTAFDVGVETGQQNTRMMIVVIIGLLLIIGGLIAREKKDLLIKWLPLTALGKKDVVPVKQPTPSKKTLFEMAKKQGKTAKISKKT